MGLLFYSVIFCIVVAGLVVVIFIPFYYMGGVQVGLAVNIPILIILGGLSYNWKFSTLSKNEKSNGKNKIVDHLSIITFAFIIELVLFLALNIFNIILAQLGLLLDDFTWGKNDNLSMLMWSRINWANYWYAFIINILVTYGVFFFFYRLMSNQKITIYLLAQW